MSHTFEVWDISGTFVFTTMPRFLQCILLFFPVLITHLTVAGQEVAPWSGCGIEVNGIAGKVYKHEAKFTLPIPSVSTAVDVNLMLHTYGKKVWEERRHFPTIGLGITYTDYGLDAIYGQCVGIYPNLELPIISGKKIEWTLRIGDGVGYVTRHFSRFSPLDTVNVAIGSHVNDFFMLMTDVRYHINSHWDMQLGANIDHISDASYHKPNLGINMYGAHIGLRYFPVTSRPPHLVRKPDPLRNRWLVQARLGMAYVSENAPGGPLYPVYVATGYVSRRWLSKNKMFAGMDYSYHTDIYSFLRNNGFYPGSEAQHSYKTAVFVGNEFLIGRVGAVLQLGVYTQQAALKTDPYYEKVGGDYYLVQREHGPIKEFCVSAFLKTHKIVAEFGEIGLGVGF